MQSNDKIVERYYFKNVAARVGENKKLKVWQVKKERKIGIEYEIYSNKGSDPNMYLLNNDPNYNRRRVRKITVYFDNKGNLRENIQNDYPLNPDAYNDPKYNFRQWG